MANIKSKVLAGCGIILFLFLALGTFMYFENYEEIYYTKVDNEKIKIADITSDMKYIYTLECYNKNGKKKDFNFKTNRELKNNSFLELEIRSAGVHSWQEVDESELPEKVKEKYR